MGINNNPANSGQIVDDYINTAYDTVKVVADNIAALVKLAGLTGSHQASDTEPTTRPDGSDLESGDTYFNTATSVTYTWNDTSDSWVAMTDTAVVSEVVTVDATMASTGTITLTNSYAVGDTGINVFLQGVFQTSGVDYTETDSHTLDFGSDILLEGDLISVVIGTVLTVSSLGALTHETLFTTTASQAAGSVGYTIPESIKPSKKSDLNVYVQGTKQASTAYAYDSVTGIITFSGEYPDEGDEVQIINGTLINSIDIATADDVEYTPAGGTATTVAATLNANRTRNYDTLAATIADVANITIGDKLELKERVIGYGGGGAWDVIADVGNALAIASGQTNIVTATTDVSLQLRTESGFVNVKQWGALGDTAMTPGTAASYATGTDCTAVITAAIAYLDDATIQNDGGTLYFPKGHYRFDAVTVNTRLVVAGDGIVSRITLNSNQNVDFLTFTTDVQIKEIFIDGNEDNQTSGAALVLTSADFFKLRNISVYHGKDYNVSISGGNQGVIEGCKIISSSGYGVRLANHMVLNIINGTTIEDNATGGLLVAGSSTSCSVMINGCYFENNDTSGVGSYHIECTDFQSQVLGNIASHFISVQNCYLNGAQSNLTQKCFYFSGTGLDNNVIKNNFLLDMAGDIWTFDTITSAEVGFNDIRDNVYGTDVAIPVVKQHGFYYDTSRRVNLKGDEHDAAVATIRKVLLPYDGSDTLIGRVTHLSITYTGAANASETGTIGVGTEGANSSIYTGNISTTAVARDSIDLTGALVTNVIEDLTAPSQLLTSNFTGGGTAKFVIYMDAIIW